MTNLNRRQFLSTATQAVAGAMVAGPVSRLRAAATHPGGDAGGSNIIDTHTHFYDPHRPEGVPWPPRNDKLLYRTVLPKTYRSLPVPRPVTGTVVVEASPWIEDNQWLLDLAANEPFIVGIVGHLPVGTKQFAGHLKRFVANRLFRGIRIRDRKLNDTLEDAAFLSDLKLLANYDLSLDLVGGLEILTFADQLSERLPELRIIIDHLAGVQVDGKAPPTEWMDKMSRLTQRRNVYFKVSGLVEGTGQTDGSAPSDAEFYRPVLDAMWTMFGPERLIYASNWPVSERFAPLARVQGIVENYFSGHGTQALEQVFCLNGKAAYRWKQRQER